MASQIKHVSTAAQDRRDGRAPVAGGCRAGPAGGAERDLRHERDPRPDPGDLEADQAARRVVAGDRRDHRTDLRHHRADQRAGAERRDPGRLGRRGRTRLLGRRRGSAAAGGTVGRGDAPDRRAGATIQTDTHDAVAAMEQSTQGVVEGARLSDAAGTALGRHRRGLARTRRPDHENFPDDGRPAFRPRPSPRASSGSCW